MPCRRDERSRAGEQRAPPGGRHGAPAAGQDGTRTGSSEWELHTPSLPGPPAVPAGRGTGRAEGTARVQHRQGTSGWAQCCTRGRQRQSALELSCTEALETESSQKNQPLQPAGCCCSATAQLSEQIQKDGAAATDQGPRGRGR